MSDKITRVAEGIISKEQAESYGWLEAHHKINGFLGRYNESQKDGGKDFTCFPNEILPKFLAGANFTAADLSLADLRASNLTGACMVSAELINADLRGADLIGADLTGADLTDADLTDANLIGADLIGADLTNAKIDAASLLSETDKLSGVDFTNTQLFEVGELLEIEPSRKIIIDRMVELKITDAIGLGDDYQTALKDAGLVYESPKEIVSEAESAPSSLAKKGFVIVAGMPHETQMENISRDPNVGYPLDADEYNPTPN